MQKIQSSLPCPQESQAQQGGEPGLSRRGHQVSGTDFKQKYSFMLKSSFILLEKLKNKIQEFCNSHKNRMSIENIVPFTSVLFGKYYWLGCW